MQTADKLDDRFDRVTISRFIHDTRGYLTLSDVSMQPEGTLRGRGRWSSIYVLTRNIRSKVDAARAQLGTVYNFVQSFGCNIFSRWNIRSDRGKKFFDRVFTTRVDDDQAVVDIHIRYESFNAIRGFIALSAGSDIARPRLSRPSHPIFDARKTGVAVSDWSVSRFIPRDERRRVGTPQLPQPDLSPRHSLSGANKLAGEKDGGTTDARWLP